MKITHCKVNHLNNPLGYDLGSHLRFSWITEEAEGKRQHSARLQIAADAEMKNLLLDTGEADLSSIGTDISLELSARTVYYWMVAVTSDRKETAVSPVQRFETGKQEESWSGKWISCYSEEPRHPAFVKKFRISSSAVQKARLYITGLGLYEAMINGQRVSDEYLTPYCNDYDEWIQYQTFDVTELLRQGENDISVLLGHGWYSGRFGYDSLPKDPGRYGKDFFLIAELHVTAADGTESILKTDESWQVQRSRILFSNIYDGEVLDDTLSNVPERPARLVEAQLAESLTKRISARYSQPVRIICELPVKKQITPKGEMVLDAGQNLTGTFRLRLHEPKGTVIRVRFAELLQDGSFYTDNLRTAEASYYYVSDGAEHILSPHFTFYGYRYATIDRIRAKCAEKEMTAGYDAPESMTDFLPENFTALSVATDLPGTGTLRTGNKLVNQLISNISWSCRDNFLDVPTDCPQRDERMGWTADTQVFSPSACYLHDTYAFYRKYLHDMAMEQKKFHGGVPYTVPSFGVLAGSSVWGDAATILPMNLYRFYGDTTILEEQFDSMKAWAFYVKKIDGTNKGWRRAFHFGDWLALDTLGAETSIGAGATDKGFIGDVYYLYSVELTTQAAHILGKEQDAKELERLALEIRTRISADFYDSDGRCRVDTQTGLLLTLRYHLAPREIAKKRLCEKFEETEGKLNCGFVGAPIMNGVLAENGMDALAAGLLLNEEYPGWLHEIRLGATTVWERWNSLDESGHVSSTGMNSMNHYAYGSVLEWLYANVAGIAPAVPGFKKVTFSPKPIPELKELSCRYASIAGTYGCSWRFLRGGRVQLTVSVPFDCSAMLIIPGKKGETVELSAGEYTYLVDAGE